MEYKQKVTIASCAQGMSSIMDANTADVPSTSSLRPMRPKTFWAAMTLIRMPLTMTTCGPRSCPRRLSTARTRGDEMSSSMVMSSSTVMPRDDDDDGGELEHGDLEAHAMDANSADPFISQFSAPDEARDPMGSNDSELDCSHPQTLRRHVMFFASCSVP